MFAPCPSAALLVGLLAPALALKTGDDHVKPFLQLRGGLRGVDPAVAAKTYYTLALIHSGMISMAPENTGKRLHNIYTTPTGVFIFEDIGVSFLCQVVTILCVLNGVAAGKAFAWGLLPLLYAKVRDCLNGRFASLGISLVGQ